MAVSKKQDTKAQTIEVQRIRTDEITYCILGSSPYLSNAMSEKVRRGLLEPGKKKTTKQKEATLKHNPLEEYRGSIYASKDDDSPTRILMRAAAFKRSMQVAAIYATGINGTDVSRLLRVLGPDPLPDFLPLFGIPQLKMDVVRLADGRAGLGTPDVRTWAILPEWATRITLRIAVPHLRRAPVTNLLANAGEIAGVGDGRVERGKLSFGTFDIVPENDERFQRIVKIGTLKAQDEALASPTCYDGESERLLDWWAQEIKDRGFEAA